MLNIKHLNICFYVFKNLGNIQDQGVTSMKVPQLDGINGIDEILFMVLTTVDNLTKLEKENHLKLSEKVKI